ncbi:MAG TPA: BTAD domain-containing putative transcriptional regulator [Ramlibacter sp.]|nr:BTAD domain-containing putative transcriptional regulator [Ramlibacter sp.]
MPAKQVALAKLSRPRLHDVLARPQLLAQLDEAASRSFVWVWAQPGAGKTTLVTSWLDARKRSGIWYQIDPADSDPASFVYHLRMAADSIGARTAQPPLPLLDAEYLRDLGGFSRRFFRELFSRLGPGGTLVLDNLQDVPEAAALHRMILEMAPEVPPGINVVVVSRMAPAACYAPLLADGRVAVLDGQALRFTLEETAAVAHKRGLAEAAAVERLHERSNGWAAGLTLLLARGASTDALKEDDSPDSLQHVFGYFALRVFEAVPPAQQEALLRLCWLPTMTSALAEALTGVPDAGRLLDKLHRAQMFTDRRRVGLERGENVYQFHALFRTFLQHRCREQLPVAQLRQLLAQAGGLLYAQGASLEALPLLAEAEDWHTYGRALGQCAEALIGQGRRQTLGQWIGRMPRDAFERDPWLGYWDGRARVQAEPARGLEILEASYERFRKAGDVAGQLACGGAAVHTLFFARLGWSEASPWVDRMEPLLSSPARFPSATIELGTYAGLHAALAFCRIGHPALASLALRLLSLLDEPGIEGTPRLTTATHLLSYFHNAGLDALAQQVIGRIEPTLETRPASTLSRAFWHVFRAIYDMRQARYEEASAHFQRAEDLACAENLMQAEFAALQFRTYLESVFRRFDAAHAHLARMEKHPARSHRDAEMNYWLGRTLLAQAQGRKTEACGHARKVLAAVEEVGAAYFRAAYPPLVASAFADVGDFGTAMQLVADARRLIQGTYLQPVEAQLLLEEAYIDHARGDGDAACRRIAEALRLGVADAAYAGYVQRVVCRHGVLLEIALKAGIETEWVRRTLRMWRYPPPQQEIPAWPWPIRVRTLGAFEVSVNDAPIEFGRKAPKKTLALLKAVIARGGSAPESALVDTFWPDETGDAAAKSLTAAVMRLRGLLGDAEAIVQQGGSILLDRNRVWVDAWSFERAVNSPANADRPDGLQDALNLYRGAFLAQDEGESWPVAARERLRSRFIHAVATHAAALEAQQRFQEAVEWYLRGIDADSVVEPFYQGLMRCYHRLDRMPEAVSAYRRLKQVLSVTISLPPSAATEKLYQSLRLDATRP